jgi:hypothetical protein
VTLGAREYITVACDESGNEGENLTRAGSRVFAHASVSIDAEVAGELIWKVRRATGSQSAEVKSSVILKPASRDVLSWLLTEPQLVGKASVHLTEKRYFVSGKVVDLIVENLLYGRDHDLFRYGRARDMAFVLYEDAPRQFGEDWDTALDQFNTMLRLKVRNGQPQATLDDFYASVDLTRPRAVGRLKHIMRLIHAGRDEVADLIRNTPTTSASYLSLDPLFAAIGQTARTWFDRSGLPVKLVHDETSLLTDARIESLKLGLSAPAVATLGVPPVPLVDVTLVDSATDSRVQVADLLAGAARVIADESLSGTTHSLVSELRPHLDPDSLWGDSTAWQILTGQPLTPIER